jgi:hypothetical protein
MKKKKKLKKKNRAKRSHHLNKILRMFFISYKNFKNKWSKKKKFLKNFALLNKQLLSKFFFLLNTKKTPFNAISHKNLLSNGYHLLIKKKKIENFLKYFIKKNVELKFRNFIKSSKTSYKFKQIYLNFYNDLRQNKINFFNRQFKEIYSTTSLALYLSKSKILVYLFSLVIGYGRYRLLKKNLYYLFNLVEALQSVYCTHNSVRINISGKFKGKAKRTQLKYFKTNGMWNVRTVDNGLLDYHVGFVGTRTGIFGIKIWIN